MSDKDLELKSDRGVRRIELPQHIRVMGSEQCHEHVLKCLRGVDIFAEDPQPGMLMLAEAARAVRRLHELALHSEGKRAVDLLVAVTIFRGEIQSLEQSIRQIYQVRHEGDPAIVGPDGQQLPPANSLVWQR